MGLDVFLEARITEKATGRCISAQDKQQPGKRADVLQQFKANPQAYEWSFRMFNSY